MCVTIGLFVTYNVVNGIMIKHNVRKVILRILFCKKNMSSQTIQSFYYMWDKKFQRILLTPYLFMKIFSDTNVASRSVFHEVFCKSNKKIIDCWGELKVVKFSINIRFPESCKQNLPYGVFFVLTGKLQCWMNCYLMLHYIFKWAIIVTQ